jgi:predicted thioesterase
MKDIPEGLSDEMTVETTPDMGAAHLPVPMYSTPTMVGHIEATCLKMILPYLEPGETSVGYKVNVKHMAPTPIGMKVTVKSKVKEADGKKIEYEIEVYNETGAKIGEGSHERRVIDMSRFARPS